MQLRHDESMPLWVRFTEGITETGGISLTNGLALYNGDGTLQGPNDAGRIAVGPFRMFLPLALR